MSRLTRKDYNETYDDKNILEDGGRIVDLMELKLGQLEDIEEEFGIDLITLLKAVRDGVYLKVCYGTCQEHITYSPFRVDYWRDCIKDKEGWLVCGMEPKDYGKTWALTKEELENERNE